MLILSRRLGESVIVNNDIVITVVKVQGDKVRIGIEAPKEIPVHRKEIQDRVNNEKAQSEIEQ